MLQIVSDRDIQQIKLAHRRLKANTFSAIATAEAEAGDFALAYVRAYPGFKPRSGALQAATGWRTVRISGGRILRIRNTKSYAGPIDQGARPHIIRARRRKTLAFMSGGKMVFRRQVQHPGNRPYKFLYRATNAAGRVLKQSLDAQMTRIARAF